MTGATLTPDDFGEPDMPNERGWGVLDAFKSKVSRVIVVGLFNQNNSPVPVHEFRGFTRRHFNGMNGASVHPGLPYRLVLVHPDRPFEENEIQFRRNPSWLAK